MKDANKSSERKRAIDERLKDYSFPEAIEKAYKKDVKLLCALIAEGHPKTPQDRDALVRLLKQRIGLKKKGRPQERVPNKTADMEELIVNETRQQIDLWKAANGRKQMPKGEIEKIADAIAEKYDDWGELWGVSISRDNILKSIKRGPRNKARPRKS